MTCGEEIFLGKSRLNSRMMLGECMLCEELPHVCTCTPEKESQSSLRAMQYDVVNLWQSLTNRP